MSSKTQSNNAPAQDDNKYLRAAMASASEREPLQAMSTNSLLAYLSNSPASANEKQGGTNKSGMANPKKRARSATTTTTSSDATGTAADPGFDSSIELPEDDGDGGLEFRPALNCNAVRSKIRALIDSGAVKVTHFQRELGVNSNSYGRFMKLNGPWTGIDNGTYSGAYKYFRRREIAGLKAVPSKPTSAGTSSSNGTNLTTSSSNKKAKTSSAATKSTDANSLDVSDIHLDGEDKDKVQVYDTPGEIRRKINAHLKRTDVTQASFLRAISAQFHARTGNVTASSLATFRRHTAPERGNTSVVFYGAYVYFEKLRVKEGKAKSKHRLEMERIWGKEGGFDVTRDNSRGLWCGPHERPTFTQYGELKIVRV